MTDQQIIEHLKSGDQVAAFTALYKAFPMVKSHVRKHSGTSTEAEDIFQEALIILLKKVHLPEFQLSSSLSTYVFGISKFLWNNELRKRKPHLEFQLDHAGEIDPTEYNEMDERIGFAQKALQSVSERCREIFQLFYIERLSMKSIAEKLGYTNEQNAKTQKYKCLEKARESYDVMSNQYQSAEP